MATGIRECAQPAFAVSQNDDGDTDKGEGEIVARVGNLVDRADEVPRLFPDAFDLPAVELGRGIAPGRHRLGLEQRSADGFVMRGIERIGLREHL
jgi:hypothetical protein